METLDCRGDTVIPFRTRYWFRTQFNLLLRTSIRILTVLILALGIIAPTTSMPGSWHCEGRACGVNTWACCCQARTCGIECSTVSARSIEEISAEPSLSDAASCHCRMVLEYTTAVATTPVSTQSFGPLAYLPVPTADYNDLIPTAPPTYRADTRGPPQKSPSLSSPTLRAPPIA